jgi:hypothetical protein
MTDRKDKPEGWWAKHSPKIVLPVLGAVTLGPLTVEAFKPGTIFPRQAKTPDVQAIMAGLRDKFAMVKDDPEAFKIALTTEAFKVAVALYNNSNEANARLQALSSFLQEQDDTVQKEVLSRIKTVRELSGSSNDKDWMRAFSMVGLDLGGEEMANETATPAVLASDLTRALGRVETSITTPAVIPTQGNGAVR